MIMGSITALAQSDYSIKLEDITWPAGNVNPGDKVRISTDVVTQGTYSLDHYYCVDCWVVGPDGATYIGEPTMGVKRMNQPSARIEFVISIPSNAPHGVYDSILAVHEEFPAATRSLNTFDYQEDVKSFSVCSGLECLTNSISDAVNNVDVSGVVNQINDNIS